MVSSRNALTAVHAARGWNSNAVWRWIPLPLAAAMLALDVSWTREVMESRPWPGGGVLGAALACGAAFGAVSGPGGVPATDGLWMALAAAPLLMGTALLAGGGGLKGTMAAYGERTDTTAGGGGHRGTMAGGGRHRGTIAAERGKQQPEGDACMPVPTRGAPRAVGSG
jgi:hypothetical protein